MRIPSTTAALAAAAFTALVSAANAQQWTEDFDTYPSGTAIDPDGQASAGNGWESWSSGLASSIVVDNAPAPPAFTLPHLLSNNPGADTVNNYGGGFATSGVWEFDAMVYNRGNFQGQAFWIMLNTYTFGGPYNWSIQVFFDGTLNQVDCDCAGQNDPSGPQELVREAWVPIHAEIDLDDDTVDLFYDGRSLTGGQGYVWTHGIFGTSSGVLEVQALNLFPDVAGNPATTEMYYDRMRLAPANETLGVNDSACLPVPNSTGLTATIDLQGSGAAGADVTAQCSGGPPHEFGYFITGPNSGLYIVPPGSMGVVCIDGPQYRYNSAQRLHLFQFDASGISQTVAVGGACVLETNGAFPGVPPLMTGETRAFQAWYRDGASSNFSQSKRIAFD
ncbi:MAG: hypothetical protein GY711_33535 [bacterium]|nr:hypothetical protein [bacterium]